MNRSKNSLFLPQHIYSSSHYIVYTGSLVYLKTTGCHINICGGVRTGSDKCQLSDKIRTHSITINCVHLFYVYNIPTLPSTDSAIKLGINIIKKQPFLFCFLYFLPSVIPKILHIYEVGVILLPVQDIIW